VPFLSMEFVTPRVSNPHDYVNHMSKTPSKSRVKFEVFFKFCVVWTMKLRRRVFRINWSRIGRHSQKRNCF
jgi:hypothetical protein